jgi:hypothetical protein
MMYYAVPRKSHHTPVPILESMSKLSGTTTRRINRLRQPLRRALIPVYIEYAKSAAKKINRPAGGSARPPVSIRGSASKISHNPPNSPAIAAFDLSSIGSMVAV